MAANRRRWLLPLLTVVLSSLLAADLPFARGAAPETTAAAGDNPADSASQKPESAENSLGQKTDGAVEAALGWLARHQLPDGRWSLDYATVCKDDTCTGSRAMQNSDTAATALALMPFLAAGQTHKTKGSYQRTIQNGLAWMMRNQKPDGDLRGGSSMYAHGLATIAVANTHGLSSDRAVGLSAQAAVNFIQRAQNAQTGGWRYSPGDEGDTSVLGWQMEALEAARLAGLQVDPAKLEGARKWLKSVAQGQQGGKFSYVPGSPPTPTMTAEGLLANQHLDIRANAPEMVEGLAYLKANMPGRQPRNAYFSYFATRVWHNVGGPDWETWRTALRKSLIEIQCREGCAAGSWDPAKPTADTWGQHGGRLLITSLSALSLEVGLDKAGKQPPADALPGATPEP
jgi:hypothetical protein